MYDIEKHFAILENVAGFARLDTYIYSPVGVCLYIGETNFPFPEMLYESECHQPEFLKLQIFPRILVYDWDP